METEKNLFQCDYEKCKRLVKLDTEAKSLKCSACGQGTLNLIKPKNYCVDCGNPIYANVNRGGDVSCGCGLQARVNFVDMLERKVGQKLCRLQGRKPIYITQAMLDGKVKMPKEKGSIGIIRNTKDYEIALQLWAEEEAKKERELGVTYREDSLKPDSQDLQGSQDFQVESEKSSLTKEVAYSLNGEWINCSNCKKALRLGVPRLLDTSYRFICPYCNTELSQEEGAREIKETITQVIKQRIKKGYEEHSNRHEQHEGNPKRKRKPRGLEDFGKRIIIARKQLGWTQKIFAEKSGKAVRMIRYYEEEKFYPPKEIRQWLRKVERGEDLAEWLSKQAKKRREKSKK